MFAKEDGGVGHGDGAVKRSEDADDADLLELHAAIVEAVGGGVEQSDAGDEPAGASRRRSDGLARSRSSDPGWSGTGGNNCSPGPCRSQGRASCC